MEGTLEARTTGSTVDVVSIWSMQQQRPAAAAAGKRAAAVAVEAVAGCAPSEEGGSREGSCSCRAGTDSRQVCSR
jgi:hypothetical protein